MSAKIFTILLTLVCVSAKVLLRDNGYEGVVIAIENSLSVEYCQNILQGIESLMSSSSHVIFSTTRGRASFKKVSVLVPSSWTPSVCPFLQGNLQTARDENWNNADIRISEGRHPEFGARPWTLQSRGCAQQGDYISVGYETLLHNETNINGRNLAHSWLKYRYGVFDEIGIDVSTTHPTSHRNSKGEWVSTACTNNPLNLNEICNISDITCTVDVPSIKEHKDIRGSFMAFPEVQSVVDLCDEGTHDSVAPTPHNLICGTKSVWEVLRASSDFQNNRNVEGLSRAGNIEFSYLKSNVPRMVLLVEDTNIMNAQKRWDFMRKAVRKFINYDVPDNFQVGLVVFDAVASVKYPLKSLSDDGSRENLGSSLPRNPSRVDKHQRCVSCGLEESLKILRRSGTTDGSHIVLVLAGSGHVDTQELHQIEKLLSNTNIILHIIVYPLIERYPEPGGGIEIIGSRTGGLVFTVPDEGIGSDSKIKMYYNLLDSLYHTLTSAAGENVLPVKVHAAEHIGGFPHSKGTFWIDAGLGSDTVFEVFYYDLAHVGDSIHLINPHSQVIDTGNMQYEDDNMNMITIRLRNNQEAHGLWRYELENRADSHQALFVQVTSRPQKFHSKNNIKVRAWTNQPDTQVNFNDMMKPYIIFTEIRAGIVPVEEAKVTAILTKLGYNSNGTSQASVRVMLLDNGLLSPDIKRGDGVYSRYIYGLSDGKYSITVLVEGFLRNNNFTRHIRMGVIDVIGSNDQMDIIPPSRITNLRATILPSTDGQVSLAWSAPGDDYDYGQAYAYKLIINKDIEILRDEPGSTMEDWPRPLPSHSIQQHTITWRNYDELYYLAIFAVDESENAAMISNIVEIFIPSPISVLSTEITLQSLSDEYMEISVESSLASDGFTTRQLLVLFGCVASLLLLLLCAILYWVSRKNNSRTEVTERKDSYNVSVTLGNTESDFSKEKQSQNSALKTDYLGPINSWSPSELLKNHLDKEESLSDRSDNNSNHSEGIKKNPCGESFDTPNYYSHDGHYPYEENGYNEAYPAVDSYPDNISGFTPSTSNCQVTREDYQTNKFFNYSRPQTDLLLTESSDILPISQGPPGYSVYPDFDHVVKEESKIPPPIPPKPKIPYPPESYIYEGSDLSDRNSNASVTSDKIVRNVTMVYIYILD